MEAEQNLKSEVEQFQVPYTPGPPVHAHTFSSAVQDRLTRCAQQCEDECRDMLPPNAQQQDMDKVQKHAGQCLMKCADDNIKRIPQVVARFRHSLGSSYNKKW